MNTNKAKRISNSLSEFYFLIHGGKRADIPNYYRFNARHWCNLFRAIGFDVCPSDIGHYADNGLLFRHIGYFVRVSNTEFITDSVYFQHYHEYFDELDHYIYYKNFDGVDCRLYLNHLFAILYALKFHYLKIATQVKKTSKRGKRTRKYYLCTTDAFNSCNEGIKNMIIETGLVKIKE